MPHPRRASAPLEFPKTIAIWCVPGKTDEATLLSIRGPQKADYFGESVGKAALSAGEPRTVTRDSER
ncbi:hypothetical protein Sp245p_28770 (plasmid) [Azospirillum baldaniorum]|uniref:Uncharacterized protein n=1 Tax=Azospirillum baldaniorum TaxID=1064539 RepID=A0A9P1NQG5_9PROT|nr:hypothetical protein Sp245p_28770 [Azospirillum baldaniorum]CCD01969.1 protein of unknown function [Azospirillum baldaniorum]